LLKDKSTTREKNNIENLQDLKDFFSNDTLIIFNNELKLNIKIKDYPIDENHFYLVEYEYNGERLYKKLPNNGDSIIINREKLFKVDGKAIKDNEAKNLLLLYRDEYAGKTIEISYFALLFADDKQFRDEIEVIIKNTNSLSKEDAIRLLIKSEKIEAKIKTIEKAIKIIKL